MTINSRFFAGTFLGIILFFTHGVFAQQALLTPEQNAWLDKNKRTIIVHPQESDPPYVFTGSGSAKEVKGFSVEYIQAIAKKLNIKIVFAEPQSLDQILAGARERNDGIILSVTPTAEREQYLYFTDSYYDTPAVIAVRKDFSSNKKVVSLTDFIGKKVGIANAYAAQSYVQANYPGVNLISVTDDQTALQKLLLGDVDAVVMDFGSLSYYTSNDVLSYIRVVGRTGFEYKHSIAVPKTSPELVLILNTGLKSLSDAERQVITNKWLEIILADPSDTNSADTTSTHTLTVWLVFVGFIIFIIATIIIVLLLRRRSVSTGTKPLHDITQHQLEELRAAQETLKEDMEQVALLEKSIEEHIK